MPDAGPVLPASQIFRRSDLDVVIRAVDQGYRKTGVFQYAGAVRKKGLFWCCKCLSKLTECKCLGCLYKSKPTSVQGNAGSSRRYLPHGILDRYAGDSRPRPGRRFVAMLNDGSRNKRANAVVDGYQPLVRLNSGQPIRNGLKTGGTARYQLNSGVKIVLVAEGCPAELIAGGKYQNDVRSGRDSQKTLNGMLKDGFAVEQQKLLGHVGIHAAAATPGHDNGEAIMCRSH